MPRLTLERSPVRLWPFAVWFLGLAFASSALTAQVPVDFAHDIAPLIRQHCGQCHTDGHNEGELAFNTREELLRSEIVDLKDPQASEFLARLKIDDPLERMPLNKDPLSDDAIQLFQRWIEEGLVWDADFSFESKIARPLNLRPVVRPESADLSIDLLLDAEHDESLRLIDDRAFIRRASLDLIGLLPTAAEVEQFVADPDPNKRSKMVDRLLDDKRGYTEHWLSFWNDLLRNDYSGTGYIDGGRAPITDWLYRSLMENKPYDAMVRELIVPFPGSEGFSRGIKWRGRINASQVVELQFAQNVGQVFLGLNLKCASCHDSFIDSWKLTDAYGLAAVIADAPLEMHRCDQPQGTMAQAAFLFPELGTIDPAAPRDDRLAQLAAIMVKPENGRFSRTIVNRLWQRLMGRGLVEPMDSMDSPAWNEDLLDWLAADLVNHGFDLKHTLRIIASSKTYQRVSAPPPAPGEPFVFDGPLARRLTAEQWLDAIWQITGTNPEQPAVDFGYRDDRPVRASLVNADRLMRVLGRPNREQVVTTRPATLTTLEAVELTNGAPLMHFVEQGADRLVAQYSDPDPSELIKAIYVSSLSRLPSDQEIDIARELIGTPANKQGVADVLWIVLMLPEFCFNR